MCVWCPLWPVQRLLAEQPELERSRPIILFTESRRGLSVAACSLDAVRAGICVGMPLGEARSLLPGTTTRVKSPGRPHRNPPPPIFRRADPAADRVRLRQLALHCQRYSPLAGLEEAVEPESIWLDISGSESLFGGEERLIETIRVDFAQQGFQVRIAIADTWGTAWAVSHFGPTVVCVVAPGRQAEALSPGPVAALRVPLPTAQALQTLDVSTIGGFLRLPRTAVPSRFGKDLLRRLDQALGELPELLTAERLLEPLFAEWEFEVPVADRQTFEHVLGVLLDQVLSQLQERRASLRELNCRWLGSTTEPISLRLLRPTTDRRHLLELLWLQCERRVFVNGIRGIRMELIEMGLPPIKQTRLFEDDADSAERHQQALAELVDRLGSRLGSQSVLRPALRPDSQPEYACECVPWLSAGAAPPSPAATEPSRSQLRCRPLRLLRSPQPLTIGAASWNGSPTRVQDSPVVRIAGPERIEAGWWRGPDARRDYYRVDLASGTTLWAFIDRTTGRWFLHGLFV
jgi:protein ImuB